MISETCRLYERQLAHGRGEGVRDPEPQSRLEALGYMR